MASQPTVVPNLVFVSLGLGSDGQEETAVPVPSPIGHVSDHPVTVIDRRLLVILAGLPESVTATVKP